MSEKSGLQTKNATAKPTVALSQPGILQRSCECGGVSGLTGQCEECSGKRLSGQRRVSNPPPPRGDEVSHIAALTAGHSFRQIAVQAKLAIGQPNDKYEQEADRVAEQVMRMPNPTSSVNAVESPKIQRLCNECEAELQRQPQKPEDEKTKALTSAIAPVVQREVKPPQAEDEEDKTRLQAKSISDSSPSLSSGIQERITGLQQGGGQPLPVAERAFFEPRFGHNFSQVKIHTDARAAQTARGVNARAFTVGRHIVFGAGQYQPRSSEGQRLLAHELTHVIQQNSESKSRQEPSLSVHRLRAREQIVQRATNASDPRLPATQTDALTYAAEAEAAINGAKTRLAASSEPERRNVPNFITSQGLSLQAMTPRHDSTPNAPNINFFFGSVDYSDSLVLPQTLTYHITSNRAAVRIRAREEGNVDNSLSGAEIENRLVRAVREVAYTSSATSGTPATFDLYRARFNSLWDTTPFATMSTAFDPTLDSKGPRTTRSRAIFNRIYQEDTALQTAYDQNTGGIRERIDTYLGPEGFNPISSSRLQALRAVFASATVPVTSAQYPTFRGNVQAAANALDDSDRRVVEQSNDWQRLINEYVTTQVQRQEIRSIIATPPPPPTPPTPPPTPSSAPPPPPTSSSGVTPQQFVNSIRIDGPTSPVVANARRQQITLTPRSSVANPNVAIQSRLTVTPANRVQGANVSPDSTWPNAATAGVPFQPEIINTSTVNMTAHLDLVNGPTGLAPSPPIPDVTFQVQDNRQANFLAIWRAAVNFNNGSSQEWFTGSNTVRYRGGTQNFNAIGMLPSGQTNPGLALSVRASLKRGTTLIAGGPTTLTPFPADQSQTGRLAMNISAPATVPATGDPLTFEVELTDASGTTVLGTKTISMTVMPEQTYTRAQAIAAATADEAHLRDTSPTGLLGQMTALGGQPARVAAAIINPLPTPTSPLSEPRITLHALTVRHDSAAFVTQSLGAPNPAKVGYFFGDTYQPLPNTANSFVSVAGAAAFRVPSFGPRFIVANRTTDVFSGTKRPDSSLITLIVHEAVHAMDVRPGASTEIERYKTEFRAYWMDGRFGPPNQGTCPPPTTPLTGICATSGCLDTAFRPELSPPGPKSCRSRAIFNNLYGSTTYPFVKPAYDNNVGGFRDAVDNYLIPDGINLMVSVRLEALRGLIEGFTGSGFTTLRTNVQAFMGSGTPPALGVVDADERNTIRNSRAWRDLVDRKITNTTNRTQLKTDLGIPQ